MAIISAYLPLTPLLSPRILPTNYTTSFHSLPLTQPLKESASPFHLLTHSSNNPITNNIWEGEQGKAMSTWVGKSPEAAISWFESPPFTGPPRTRLNFEIINALTLLDFDQAVTRLASIPDSDRLRFVTT
ncbi:MAG: hypothetical protein ACJAVK_001335 [Akkermansiaceae bacterium]|jgi:hypothetical protein